MVSLVLMRGMPGSGKTSWAEAWVAEEPLSRVRISRSDLRKMAHDGKYLSPIGKQKGTESMIIAMRDAMIRQLLKMGYSVVVDDTNLSPKHVQHFKRLAYEALIPSFVIQDHRNVPFDTCQSNNRRKPTPLPEEAMVRFYEIMMEGLKEELTR